MGDRRGAKSEEDGGVEPIAIEAELGLFAVLMTNLLNSSGKSIHTGAMMTAEEAAVDLWLSYRTTTHQYTAQEA